VESPEGGGADVLRHGQTATVDYTHLIYHGRHRPVSMPGWTPARRSTLRRVGGLVLVVARHRQEKLMGTLLYLIAYHMPQGWRWWHRLY
jgi:hypothetical protein